LEDLESRVVPAGGGASTLRAHLADAAQVAPNNPATSSGDQLDAFWSGSGQTTGGSQSAQSAPLPGQGVIQTFSSVKLNTAAPLVGGAKPREQAPLPVVTVTDPDPFASEDPTGTPGVPETNDTATFRILRTGGNINQELQVFYTIGGTAQNGVDYVKIVNSVVFPEGATFVDITVTPYPREPHGPVPLVNVTLTLQSSETYTIGTHNNSEIFIFQQASFPPSGGGPSGGGPSGGGPSGGGPSGGGPSGGGPSGGSTPVPFITVNNTSAISIALGSGDKHVGGLFIPVQTPQAFNAGLPLDPALRDRPGGLLPPALGDDAALVGGTNAVGQISGKIFEDVNGTGSVDRFKPGLAGVTVFIDLNNNGMIDQGEPTTTTNDRGDYSFTGLQAGTYVVRQAMPGNVLQTLPANEAPYEVTLERLLDARSATDLNFGLQLLSGRARPVGAPARRLPIPVKPGKPSSYQDDDDFPGDDADVDGYDPMPDDGGDQD
jgi:hypothetical protein